MATTDFKFVFVATGKEQNFSKYGGNHTKVMIRELNAEKGKAGSRVTPPAIVRFVHFDWHDDTIRVYEHEFPERGTKRYQRRQWKTLGDFTPSTGVAGFDPKSFVIKTTSGISIVDVYRAVRRAPRGSVLDVSFYSHGFIEGPVLADSTDFEFRATTGEVIRTDFDRDGRARSDFTPHMGEDKPADNAEALKKFREGFASGATFRVLGCHVQDVVDGRQFGKSKRSMLRSTALQVIRAAFIVPSKKESALGKQLRAWVRPAAFTPDMKAISLNMDHEFAIEDSINNVEGSGFTDFDAAQLKELHYGRDTVFFPPVPTTGSAPGTFVRSMSDVIKFIAREVKLGYIFKAAEALPDVICLGAVPGTGGDYEADGDKLMFIPRKTYGGVLNFYKKFMGLSLDDRNYGRFDAAGVAVINDREQNG
jgi:hypothetical protein